MALIPLARCPTTGPTRMAPRASRVPTFSWVAGWRHMLTFIAGAITRGGAAGQGGAGGMSSAEPRARRARVVAEAGADDQHVRLGAEGDVGAGEVRG